MPFIFSNNQLSEEQRRLIWRVGFPSWCLNGFDVYFSNTQKNNMLSMSRDATWWHDRPNYAPSTFIKDWIAQNYPDFKQDIKRLAEILSIKKDDYFACADYLTILYHEKGHLIRKLVAAEYMHQHLSQRFQCVTELFSEEIGILMMDESWPKNLADNLQEKYFQEEVDDFWSSFAISIDEFLGSAMRSYLDEVESALKVTQPT